MAAIRNIAAVRAEMHSRDVQAAQRLAKLARKRKPRQPGTGPHIIDPNTAPTRAR